MTATDEGARHGAPPPCLEIRRISKAFPGVQALDAVSLAVRPGQVHVLVGENGAGKSTLLNIMFGALQPDAGEILVEGTPVTFHRPSDALHRGIAMVHQEMKLVPQFSAVQNVLLGREKTRLGFIDAAARRSAARRELRRLGFQGDPEAPVAMLGVAQQQIVELARALAVDAKVIILDEPTATLSLNETERLFAVVDELRAHGHAIVFVSHRLAELFAIGDWITILRDGCVVRSMPMSSELDERTLVGLMVGRTLAASPRSSEATTGRELLRVEGLTRRGAFDDVSLTVSAGEIVTLAGMVGAGRTEVARAIVGADAADSGTVTVRGRPLTNPTPARAIEAGIAYLTEDRKKQGLVGLMSVASNITLPSPPRRMGLLSRQRQRRIGEEAAVRVALPGTVDRRAGQLSGGNQQKVVLARWLTTEAEIFIFDEPTRGIDVGAKSEIYQLMHALVERGAGILMISSELPEVLRMSTRVLVMKNGAIVAEMSRDEATEEAIVAAASLEAVAA